VELSRSSGKSKSSIIREALDLALPYLSEGMAPNLARQALVMEYNQIVLELLAKQYFPEEGDQIIEVARERLDQFHVRPGSPAILADGYQSINQGDQ